MGRLSNRMKLDTVTTQDNDPTCVTYIINGEDDTLGNSLRLIIASYKEVELCQYTGPHPTEDCIHLRIQTYGKTPGTLNPYLVHFGNIQERHLWKKNPKFTF